MEEANLTFENQWQTAFDGAEMTPSEYLWTSIDGKLANQQAGILKKRIIFFKWVAVAAVFIMITSISELFLNNYNQSIFTSENINTTNEFINNKSALTNYLEDNCSDEYDENLGMNIALFTSDEACDIIESEALLFANIPKESDQKTTTKTVKNVKSIALASRKEKIHTADYLVLNELTAKKPAQLSNEILAFTGKLYAVANPYVIDLVDEKNDFNLWAGLSVSSGSFNPNANKNSTEQSLSLAADFSENLTTAQPLSFSEINNENLSSGTSVSIGLDLRAQASSKIVLSSGIHYLRNNSNLNSNLVISDANTGDTYALTSEELRNSSFQNVLNSGNFSSQKSESSFRNEFQYISIPLKAGYILFDKKVNVILNSGISTNILVGANQQKSDGQTQLFDDGKLFQNDYNTIYFNLLSSVEFGYTFQEKYFFSLEPTYSQALTDFTKSAYNFSSKPKNIGLSIGLKYNF